MNIRSARYTKPLNNSQNICIDDDGVEKSVPVCPGNRHYDELMRLVEAGELTIEPYVEAERGYEELRRAEYPAIGDQLDAIWKQLNQDRLNGKELIQPADDELNRVLAVKAKYPKPE